MALGLCGLTTLSGCEVSKEGKMAKEEPEGTVDIAGALEGITTSLSGMAKLLEAQNERLVKLEAERPKFVPMRRPDPDPRRGTYQLPEELRARGMASLKKVGQMVGGRSGPMDNPDYIQMLPPEYRPVFMQGETVKVNPEAIIHGTITKLKPEGRKWGEVLEEIGSDGVGQIMAVVYIRQSYEPKYRVLVPYLTPPNGDGFNESELLFYDN